jgi:hypothetical protein
MGIGFVLLIWAVVGLIVACVGALVLGGVTAFATLEVRRFRRLTIIAASAFPFVCLGWGGAVFVFQAAVNEFLLHRDPGLGDTWECPLPNGYSLMMIDDTDNGWVYNPATQGVPGGVGEQEDAVAGVSQIQVAGRYILGSVDGKAFEHPTVVDGVVTDASNRRADSFFLLDTKTGKRQDYPGYAALVSAAQPLAIQAKFEPIHAVYQRYRFTWFDLFAAISFFGPPLLGAILLFWWVLHLRRRLATA